MTKKKVLRYEVFISFADRSNKVQDLLADLEYPLTSKENIVRLCQDMRKATNDNFKALFNFKVLRKKYITVEDKNEK